MKDLKCPLNSMNSCYKKDCAWFDKILDQCSVVTLTSALCIKATEQLMEDIVDDCDEEEEEDEEEEGYDYDDYLENMEDTDV